jgi:hypothetical protein
MESKPSGDLSVEILLNAFVDDAVVLDQGRQRVLAGVGARAGVDLMIRFRPKLRMKVRNNLPFYRF